MGGGRALLVAMALGALALPLSAASAAKQPRRPCAAYGRAVWSPDGKQIAWASGWPDHGTVCIAHADGSHLHHFSTGFGLADEIAWPRPHTLLTLADGELTAVTTSGRETTLDEAQDFVAAGGKAASDYCLPESSPGQVVVLDLSTHRKVSLGQKKLESCVISLSPDGRWVTFASTTTSGTDRAPGVGYWIARTDGTGLQRLTSPDGPLFYVFWTPAGLWQGRAAGAGERYTLVFPRRGRSVLVPTRQVVMPSPDGRWLAWDTVSRSRSKSTSSPALRVFDLRTRKVRTLALRGFPSSWSPDSRQILVGVFDRRTHCASYWRAPVPAGRPRLVLGC